MATIGSMNKRVTFRNPVVSADTSAGREAAYSDWFTTWAAVKKLKGDRAFDHGFDGLKNNYEIVCFYRSSMSALTKATRITYNGKDCGLKTYELINEEKYLFRFLVEEMT